MIKEKDSCVHCGSDCGKSPVLWNNLNFCCNGCKTVWQLLHENKLYTYYNLEKTPGIRVETSEFGNKYEFLDNKEIAQKLIVFSEGEIAKVKFYIPVIHCASCIWLLEHLNSLDKGIKYSSVNFVRKEVDITFNKEQISLRQLVELLGSIHYIPDLSQSRADKKEDTKSYKKLLYKIGVAGFVFINVMTYSLPAYFNGHPIEGKLGALLGILSYILVIPVVFYSGNDYYISAFKNLKKRNISIDLPIALGILVLFAVTSYEVISNTGGGYSDSLSGLIFFLLVGKWYQGKSYEALSFERNYKSYFPIAVTKINKQIEESILLEKIEPGDVILIRNKELIPADSILLEGKGMIDYCFVTGESTPAIKNEGDFLYAGGRQMGGIIRITVKKEVDQSHLTKLWNQDKTYKKPSDSLKTLTDKVGRNFTVVIITIALAGFLYWYFAGQFKTALFVFTSVLIIACPCALSLSVPFTFGNTMRIFGRKGLYIKNSDVVEKLSGINTIVFDKTGTLTKPNEIKTEFFGDELADEEKEAIYSLAKQSPHPMSMAVAHYLSENCYQTPEHFVEIEGRGVFGKVGSFTVKYGSEEYVKNEGTNTALNTSTVYVSVNDFFKGHFKISNQYREGIEKVIESLDDKFEMYLLSGDNDAEREALMKYFKKENMFFNQKPQDKAVFIESLQKQGKNILMTGDGLNDAGALMQSDVALSIANKVYQFSPASDAVLEADKFSLLAKFIAFSGTSLRIVYLSFAISLFYNIIGISVALSGNLSPVVAAILMPISSVSVVAFATFATRLAGNIKLKLPDASQ
jgi:Cu+-exporting ATPase